MTPSCCHVITYAVSLCATTQSCGAKQVTASSPGSSLTTPLHRTDWINKLIWKEVFFFLLIAGTRRTGPKILALVSLGMQRWGFGGIYPARQHFPS